MAQIVLLGGGGHASDILGAIEGMPELEAIGFLDDRPPETLTDRFSGRDLPNLGDIDVLAQLDREIQYLIAVGYPTGRRALWEQIRHLPHRAAILVHPTADVGRFASIGCGALVLAGARVSPLAQLGEHVHVSYLAAVGHDATVGDCSTIMPAAIVSGDVRIGEDVLVGTNATVLGGLSIGDSARIGAGAVVDRDVAAGTTVVGVPARPIVTGR